MKRILCLFMAIVMILSMASCSQHRMADPDDTGSLDTGQTQAPGKESASPSGAGDESALPESQTNGVCDSSSLVSGGLDLQTVSRLVSLFTASYPQTPSRFRMERIHLESNIPNPVRIVYECDLSEYSGEPDLSGYFDVFCQAYRELDDAFFSGDLLTEDSLQPSGQCLLYLFEGWHSGDPEPQGKPVRVLQPHAA